MAVTAFPTNQLSGKHPCFNFFSEHKSSEEKAEAKQEVNGCGARVLLTQDDMAAVKIMILWDGKEAWPTNSSHHL